MNTCKINNAIILAGGKGTRLAEQTKVIPKPMVKVGSDPAIIHIIRHFVKYGVTNIYIAGGYKIDYLISELSKKMDLKGVSSEGIQVVHNEEDLFYKANIKVIDTGYSTNTSGRIRKVLGHLPEDNKATFITYGDSFSDVDLTKVESSLLSNESSVATLTAVPFKERFGIIKVDEGSNVTQFSEKSHSVDEFINGGFIACKESLIDFMPEYDCDFSGVTLTNLQEIGKLGAYVHYGFWFAMDSQRDWEEINKIYKEKPYLFNQQ